MVLEYLLTLAPKVIQNKTYVGKYSIHGSLGHVWFSFGRVSPPWFHWFVT